MQKSAASSVREIFLKDPPEEVARHLAHLPDFAFLDSSSAEASTQADIQEAGFSILAARPTSVLNGDFFSQKDRFRLWQLWDENRISGESLPDWGFPTGGLIGTVSYDGAFRFGCYPEMLVYDHRGERWYEVGNLSREVTESTENGIVPQEKYSFRSEQSSQQFCDAVRSAQEYIEAGDIYQVNVSHRYAAPNCHFDPGVSYQWYQQLRSVSPAPHAAFLCAPDYHVLSSSPELFLHISGRHIRTSPIKGTRPRFRDPELDERSAYDLITSAKEIAELIMITDLERNDLGQICEFGSVEASELLSLKRYAQVFHLVSTVQGRLREDVNPIEALHACFPGGSITGAPKKRAREIIEELEPVPRGLYTGTIGCFGFNEESRFNILIRTAIVERDEIHFHVGAGIVADSVPEMEWEETKQKASGLLQAFHSAGEKPER